MSILHYVHDPMCSWCYAFAPTWERIQATLPPHLAVEYVLGGLAPDSDQPMPDHIRQYLQQTWRRIQSTVPGTEFNFDFWTDCEPRRSTYAACRAVLTAKFFDPALERPMIARIQNAYYREARNPSESETLCALGADLGLDEAQFLRRLESADCESALRKDLTKTRELGVSGFPGLVLEMDVGPVGVPISYTDPRVTLRAIDEVLAS